MTMQTVPLSSLQAPVGNPRTIFDDATLAGLAASIKTDGLLQNLVVVPVKGKNRYRLVTGERRYRALELLEQRGEIAGDLQIPVEIRKGLSKDDALRLATVPPARARRGARGRDHRPLGMPAVLIEQRGAARSGMIRAQADARP